MKKVEEKDEIIYIPLREIILLVFIVVFIILMLFSYRHPRFKKSDPKCCSANICETQGHHVKSKIVTPPMSEEGIADLYRQNNEQWFGNKLPKDTIIKWANLHSEGRFGKSWKDSSGVFHIVLDMEFNEADVQMRITLLHEMCHVATGKEVSEHGPLWRAKMRALLLEGAFDGLL